MKLSCRWFHVAVALLVCCLVPRRDVPRPTLKGSLLSLSSLQRVSAKAEVDDIGSGVSNEQEFFKSSTDGESVEDFPPSVSVFRRIFIFFVQVLQRICGIISSVMCFPFSSSNCSPGDTRKDVVDDVIESSEGGVEGSKPPSLGQALGFTSVSKINLKSPGEPSSSQTESPRTMAFLHGSRLNEEEALKAVQEIFISPEKEEAFCAKQGPKSADAEALPDGKSYLLQDVMRYVAFGPRGFEKLGSLSSSPASDDDEDNAARKRRRLAQFFRSLMGTRKRVARALERRLLLESIVLRAAVDVQDVPPLFQEEFTLAPQLTEIKSLASYILSLASSQHKAESRTESVEKVTNGWRRIMLTSRQWSGVGIQHETARQFLNDRSLTSDDAGSASELEAATHVRDLLRVPLSEIELALKTEINTYDAMDIIKTKICTATEQEKREAPSSLRSVFEDPIRDAAKTFHHSVTAALVDGTNELQNALGVVVRLRVEQSKMNPAQIESGKSLLVAPVHERSLLHVLDLVQRRRTQVYTRWDTAVGDFLNVLPSQGISVVSGVSESVPKEEDVRLLRENILQEAFEWEDLYDGPIVFESEATLRAPLLQARRFAPVLGPHRESIVRAEVEAVVDLALDFHRLGVSSVLESLTTAVALETLNTNAALEGEEATASKTPKPDTKIPSSNSPLRK